MQKRQWLSLLLFAVFCLYALLGLTACVSQEEPQHSGKESGESSVEQSEESKETPEETMIDRTIYPEIQNIRLQNGQYYDASDTTLPTYLLDYTAEEKGGNADASLTFTATAEVPGLYRLHLLAKTEGYHVGYVKAKNLSLTGKMQDYLTVDTAENTSLPMSSTLRESLDLTSFCIEKTSVAYWELGAVYLQKGDNEIRLTAEQSFLAVADIELQRFAEQKENDLLIPVHDSVTYQPSTLATSETVNGGVRLDGSAGEALLYQNRDIEAGTYRLSGILSVTATANLTVTFTDAKNPEAQYTLQVRVPFRRGKCLSQTAAFISTEEVTLPKGSYHIRIESEKSSFTLTTLLFENVTGKPTIEEEIPAYKKELFQNEKALFIGDSITYGGNEPQAALYRGWAGRIGIATGMKVQNNARSGAALSTAKPQNRILEKQYTPISAATKASYTYVILHGGVNDFLQNAPVGSVTASHVTSGFDSSTYAGALEELFSAVTAGSPQAKIGYIFNYKILSDPLQLRDQALFEDYLFAAREACEKWNVPLLNFYTEDFSKEFRVGRTDHIYDYLHPSSKGYDILYRYVMYWMETLPVYRGMENGNPLSETTPADLR